jgi:subtilisin
MGQRPAYSAAFTAEGIERLTPIAPLDSLSPEWAWGGSTGAGIKVAVIDSGIDSEHPAVNGVAGYADITVGPDGTTVSTEPHGDVYGHGTACAGIIRSLAPEAELYSVRVLGPGLTGKGATFAAGLRWAIESGMRVCNLSLGTTKKDFYGVLHELADLAYHRNVILVTAANNMPVPSFPSVYASVVSVGSHDVPDPMTFYYNPKPPVEFGALGIDVNVAWKDGGSFTVTGNSFAAPHIAGVVTRILGKHPTMAPFHVKSVLRALAANVRPGQADR